MGNKTQTDMIRSTKPPRLYQALIGHDEDSGSTEALPGMLAMASDLQIQADCSVLSTLNASQHN